MAIIWRHILGLAFYSLFFVPTALLLYHVTYRFLGEVHQPQRVLPFIGLTILSWCLNRLVILYANGWNVFCTFVMHIVVLRVVFHRRGWSLLLDGLKIMALTVVFEIICSLMILLFMRFSPNGQDVLVISLEDLFKPHKLLLSSITNILGLLCILMGISLWERIRSRKKLSPEIRKQQWLYTRSILRVTLLVIAALSIFALPHFLFGPDFLRQFTIPNTDKYLMLILLVGLLLGVAISYAGQDIRYIMQQKKLYTLEQQQAISRSLLQNLRFFRHNMVNMLYGLEGVLISGEKEKMADYYQQMREKCALVNNENIAALERVPNPSVGGVLLNGLNKARQLNLPYNLYVQEQVFLGNTLKDTDLCQVLGVLQDNAIEAANEAEERFVSIEIRNVDGAVEIIVKNTYSGEVSPATLTHGGDSTKDGHTGHGLKSCYHILSRRKGAFLNFWVTGQYVQAQLLLQR